MLFLYTNCLLKAKITPLKAYSGSEKTFCGELAPSTFPVIWNLAVVKRWQCREIPLWLTRLHLRNTEWLKLGFAHWLTGEESIQENEQVLESRRSSGCKPWTPGTQLVFLSGKGESDVCSHPSREHSRELAAGSRPRLLLPGPERIPQQPKQVDKKKEKRAFLTLGVGSGTEKPRNRCLSGRGSPYRCKIHPPFQWRRSFRWRGCLRKSAVAFGFHAGAEDFAYVGKR